MANKSLHIDLLIPWSLGTSLDLEMSVFFVFYVFCHVNQQFLDIWWVRQKVSSDLWREIRWNDPSQHSIFIGWFGSYRSYILIISSDWYMLAVFGAMTLPHVTGIFFKARALLWTHYCVSLGPRSVTLLTKLPSPLLLL